MVQSCQVSALQIPTARPSHGGLRHGSGLWRTERAPPSARGRRSGHLGVVCLVAQYCAKYPCYPPSERYQQHARPRARVLAPASGAVVPSERPWATRPAVPFRWRTGAMDGRASRRSLLTVFEFPCFLLSFSSFNFHVGVQLTPPPTGRAKHCGDRAPRVTTRAIREPSAAAGSASAAGG